LICPQQILFRLEEKGKELPAQTLCRGV